MIKYEAQWSICKLGIPQVVVVKSYQFVLLSLVGFVRGFMPLCHIFHPTQLINWIPSDNVGCEVVHAFDIAESKPAMYLKV